MTMQQEWRPGEWVPDEPYEELYDGYEYPKLKCGKCGRDQFLVFYDKDGGGFAICTSCNHRQVR